MSMPPEIEELKTRFPYRYRNPQIDPSVFQAPGSHIYGDVTIGKESSVWFNAVLRGDVHSIRIGDRTNIQDLTMVHVSHEVCPTLIGSDVTVGHNAILHSCTVGDNVLVGMGSQILDEAELGEWVFLGAGSLVTPKTKIPPGTKAFGRPAKVIGDLTQKEIDWIKWSSGHYLKVARTYLLDDTFLKK